MRVELLDLLTDAAQPLIAEGDPCYIGTHRTCNLQLPRPPFIYIGQRHFVVHRLADGEYVVEDIHGIQHSSLDGKSFPVSRGRRDIKVMAGDHVLTVANARFKLSIVETLERDRGVSNE